MLINKKKLNPPKTIYIIVRGYKPRLQDSWCYLNEIFYSRKRAKKYCKVHSIHPVLIKKVTIRHG